MTGANGFVGRRIAAAADCIHEPSLRDAARATWMYDLPVYPCDKTRNFILAFRDTLDGIR